MKILLMCEGQNEEILLILNEGMEKKYEKVKSFQSPKVFAKKKY